MKLLIYSLNYEPELTGIGKYSSEMARWLARAGHDVKVVTSPPYYPHWRVMDGYSNLIYKRELIGGVEVYRCPLWVPRVPSGMKRLLHLASFAFSSFPVLFFKALLWRPDVVWVVVPALFCAPGAVVAAKVGSAKAWIHVQDYEVDAAFDLGILKGAGVKRAVLKAESMLLRWFDRFSTISRRMCELALKKGVSSNRLELFPNWADLDMFLCLSGKESVGYRSRLGIPDKAVVALYSGNMGGKQGLEILAQAAERLKDCRNLYFLFCGNGSGRADLEAMAEGLGNVRFLDLQPLENLGELLQTADIHLLPQRADAADLVMPSKLTGMLASGRPIVATAHQGTEVAQVVEGRGVVVPPEDSSAFSVAIQQLAESDERRRKFGSAAQQYAVENLGRDSVLSTFEASLMRLKSA